MPGQYYCDDEMTSPSPRRSPPPHPHGLRRGHALHDGFTDLLNVLYPLLQAQFGLSYAAIGALNGHSGAVATTDPIGHAGGAPGRRARAGGRHGADRRRLRLAGLTGSLYGVIAGLLLAGLGGSTQHPIGSSLVSRLSRASFTHRARHLQFHRRRRQGAAAGAVRGDRRLARLAAGADRGRSPGRAGRGRHPRHAEAGAAA